MIGLEREHLQPHLLPLEDAQAQQKTWKEPCEELSKFIGRIIDRIDNEDKPARTARKAKIHRNHAYYRGQQSGAYSAVLDKWVSNEDDELRIINFIRQDVDRVVKQFEQSKTEVKIRSRRIKENQQNGTQLADQLARCFQEEYFRAIFRQREAKYCKLSGEYYRLIYWDKDAGALKEVPVIETQQIPIGEESWECVCGATGFASDLTERACPQCGDSSLTVTPPPMAEVDVQTGTKMVPTGDIKLEQPDPLEIDLQLRARTAKESLWIRRKRFVATEIIKAKFPDFKIESQGDTDPVLNWQRQQETSAGANSSQLFGATFSQAGEYVVFEEVWLDKVMYSQWEAPQEEKLASGTTLEKGTKLIEWAPEGLYCARVNGKLVDIFNEDKNDHWTMGVNCVIPGNIHGDGIEDMIRIQDDTNDLNSIFMMHLMRCTAPPLLYDQESTKLEQFPNKPGMSVPVQLMPGQSLAEVAYQLQPSTMPEVAGYMEYLTRQMLELAGASSLEAGAPDVDNKTATGARLSHENAVALNGLTLAIRAEVDVDTISQALKLYQKHWDEPRYFAVIGDLGEIEVKEFKASDIPQDFLAIAVPNSWLPRNQGEQREDLSAAMQLGLLDPAMPADIRRYGLQCFNIPIDLEEATIDQKLAQTKLAKIKEAIGIAVEEGLPPQVVPQFVLQQIPVRPFVDEPQAGIQVIARWLKTDEGQNADQLIQEVLMARIQEYMQLGVQQSQFMQMQSLAANAPMMASQQPPAASPGAQPGQQVGARQ